MTGARSVAGNGGSAETRAVAGRQGHLGRLVLRVLVAVLVMAGPTAGWLMMPSLPVQAASGGQSWQPERLPSGLGLWSSYLYGVACPTKTECFAVGSGNGAVLLKSTDGGATWGPDRLPSGVGLSIGGFGLLEGVTCPTSTECFAVGSGSKGAVVLQTIDAGATWRADRLPARMGLSGAASYLLSVVCPTSTECFVAGGIGSNAAVLLTTTDAGARWQAADLPSSENLSDGRLTSVACPTSAECFAVGYRRNGGTAVLLQTTDAGRSWQTGNLPSSGSGFSSLDGVACPTSTECFAAGGGIGKGAVLLQTTDGGASWQAVSLPSGVGLSGSAGFLISAVCPTSTKCFAVGTGSKGAVVLETTNAGSSWQANTLPSGLGLSGAAGDLIRVACPTSTECFAVGSGSKGAVLLETNSAGSSWQANTLPSGLGLSSSSSGFASLGGVACPTSTECFAAGSGNRGAVMLETTDDGGRWRVNTLPSGLGLSVASESMYGVACATSAECFAVGSNNPGAVVLETTNAGASWEANSLPSGLGLSFGLLHEVACQTRTECLAVGSGRKGAVLLKTNNAGVSWQGANLPSGVGLSSSSSGLASLEGVACPTRTQCFAVGSGRKGAVLLKTNNAGVSWQAAVLPSGAGLSSGSGSLASVACPTRRECFAVGSGSNGAVLLATTDGGAGWRPDVPASGLGLSGSSGALSGVACATRTECFAVGESSKGTTVLLETADGGARWRLTSPPGGLGGSGASLVCPTSTECFASGSGDTGAVLLGFGQHLPSSRSGPSADRVGPFSLGPISSREEMLGLAGGGGLLLLVLISLIVIARRRRGQRVTPQGVADHLDVPQSSAQAATATAIGGSLPVPATASRYCPSCGTANRQVNRFCEACGGELPVRPKEEGLNSGKEDG